MMTFLTPVALLGLQRLIGVPAEKKQVKESVDRFLTSKAQSLQKKVTWCGVLIMIQEVSTLGATA